MKTISLAALRAKGISLICRERCPSLKISKFYIGVPGFSSCAHKLTGEEFFYYPGE